MRCSFTPLPEADLEAIGDSIARGNPRRALTFAQELCERCVKLVHYAAGRAITP